MPINNGVIQMTQDGVIALIYYDQTQPVGSQPLINGPRGWCLDLTNPTGRNCKITVSLPNGTVTTINVGQGDPVTGGPTSGRSRTAADMAALGFTTRSSIGEMSIG